MIHFIILIHFWWTCMLLTHIYRAANTLLWSMSWFPSIFQQLTWKFLNTEKEGLFPLNPKFQKVWLVHQMEQTVSVWSDWNIWDQLWSWSSLTSLVISVSWTEMSPSFWRKLLSAILLCCFLLTRTITKCTQKKKFLFANILDKKCSLRTLQMVFQGIRRMPPTPSNPSSAPQHLHG